MHQRIILIFQFIHMQDFSINNDYKMNRLSIVMLGAMIAASTGQGSAQKVPTTGGPQKADMDLSVKPGEDFYRFAAGGWLKSHPLDAEHPMNGAFMDLEELNKKRIRSLIEGYAAEKQPEGSDGSKIGRLYRLYMDSTRRNAEGYAPIKPILERIRAINDRKNLLSLIYELDAKGYGMKMFGFSLGLNPSNSSEYLISISQGGIGLDPEYYNSPNEQQKAVMKAYISRTEDFFRMTGDDAATAVSKTNAVFAIRKRIAAVSYDQVKQRDPKQNTHILSWPDLQKRIPGIAWGEMSRVIGFPTDIDSVNLRQPEPVEEVARIYADTPLPDLKAYMEAAVISTAARRMSDDFFMRDFEFTKVVYGVKEPQPRWKRGVSFVSGLLGETVGKLYVQQYFPESSRRRVRTLIENLRSTFRDRIKACTWMTENTKKQAIDKLNAMYVNVGYPEKWENLEQYVTVDESKSLVENMENITVALTRGEIRKYWKQPVDKTQMGMVPQEVNACYIQQFNSINFPAAVLQPPFFDPNADDAANYGAIGTVIGHEMSHGFDDKGCLYDKNGNLRNWWTAEDKANYDKRARVLASWFSSQEAAPGLKVNGDKTLGENIGDNGGINIAFQAFETLEKAHREDSRDGFTPEQRFFLAYGRMWASNIAPQFVAYIVNSDVHSPNSLRVNAALPMIDGWYKAFNIRKGSRLFVPEKDRARIW